jgi:catechol-2,3-dioxygenase
MKVEPLIVVKDVQASSEFYQNILLCESGHGGDEYEMLISDGNLILQLHEQDADEHPGMYEKNTAVGNGVLLWFRTNEFESAVKRVIEFSPEIVAEPHINPNAHQNEIWFKDLDGYMIVISNNFGDAK